MSKRTVFARPDHEKALLSALITSPVLIPYVAANLSNEHFFDKTNDSIYAAVVKLHGSAKPVNWLSVSDAVGTEVTTYLKGIRDVIATPEEAEAAAEAIINQWMLRSILEIGDRTRKIEDVSDPWEVLEEIQQHLFKTGSNKINDFKPLGSAYANVIAHGMAVHNNEIPDIKLVLGLPTFERETKGISVSAGEVVVVSGRPGHGKSSVFNNIVLEAVRNRDPLMMWSGEMSRDATLIRYLAAASGVPAWVIEHGKYLDSVRDINRIEAARAQLQDSVTFSFEDMCWEDLKAQMLYFYHSNGTRIFILDRLELIQLKRRMNDDDATKARVMGDLRRMATAKRMTVFIAAQMRKSAEDNPGKIPRLADVIGGTATTNDATKVIAMVRPELYGVQHLSGGHSSEGKGMMLMLKNTFGPTIHDGVVMDFVKHNTTWRELDQSAAGLTLDDILGP